MRYERAIVMGSLAVAASLAVGLEASASTATANATANIVTSIGITKVQDLAFGNLAPGLLGGTVTVTPAGARSATGDVTLSPAGQGRQAVFNVTGDANATYAITLPNSITITNTDDNLSTMTVNGFTSNPNGTGLLTGGAQTLNVGGQLTVGALQAAGPYTGTFNVTVEYN